MSKLIEKISHLSGKDFDKKKIVELLVKHRKELVGKQARYQEVAPTTNLSGSVTGFSIEKIDGDDCLRIDWVPNGSRKEKFSRFNIEYLDVIVSFPEITFQIGGGIGLHCGRITISLG